MEQVLYSEGFLARITELVSLTVKRVLLGSFSERGLVERIPNH